MFEMDFKSFNTTTVIYSGEKIPEDFYPRECLLMRHVLYRQEKNMNVFVLVVGAVRTGKSYFSLSFIERYCKLRKIPFSVKNHVSFDLKPFLIWSQNATDNIYLLEELGTSLNPQEWFTVQSKIMRNFCQTQGFRRNILIMTLPNVAFLLKAIRFMCNYICETGSYQGQVHVNKIKMSHSRGKGWFNYLGTIKFPLPDKKTIDEYETMKKEWNDLHLKEDLNYLELLEKPDETQLLRQERLKLQVELMKARVKQIKPMEEQDKNNFYYIHKS